MLEEGLSYPMQGDDWIARMLIGGVLIFFSFLLFPAIIFYGYLVKILKETIEGSEEPPAWEDWGELFVDGLKSMIVSFVYAIVPTAVIFGIGFAVLGVGAAGESGLVAGFGLMFFLLLIPIMFLVYYLVPAALANMAIQDSIGAAFDFSTLKDVVLSGNYFIAVLMPIVVGTIVNVVSTFLGFTVIGYVFVPFVAFYGQVAIFRMFGTAFAEEMQTTSTTSTSPAAPA